MSILVSGIRLPFATPEKQAIAQACETIGVAPNAVQPSIYRQSLDARHGKITRVYTVQLDGLDNAAALADKLNLSSVKYKPTTVFAPSFGAKPCATRPVIVGMGPAGLFAGYILAKYGYQPVIFERGDVMETRDAAVDNFHKTRILDENSNIQFGEGGAGAYSDGKLTTRINDPLCEEILRILVAHGAPQEITSQAKPHIGTDILKNVVVSMRKEIIRMGGEVHFRSQLDGIHADSGKLHAISVNGQQIACQTAVLALGHSARDTVCTLYQQGVQLLPKAFSIGARIEHLQSELDIATYGKFSGHPALPPAEYNLSVREKGRACYTFCMCPGGHVVAAQSEAQTIVTNGMSYHARDGINANAAIAVSVEPTDFADGTPLGGIALQRQVEAKAYQLTEGYCAPAQKVGNFLRDEPTIRFSKVKPTYPMGTQFAMLRDCLPSYVVSHMQSGLAVFARKNRAFGALDAVLTAPETRTSSPVRMERDAGGMSTSIEGIMPCGEGAGYAGGIMSAAVDGLKVAQQIMETYKPLQDV